MYIGIDLSCYTTSCAVADDDGKIICDRRRLLSVNRGRCGLRQSEMVFEHIKNLKDIFPAGFFGVKALAVSVKPRPLKDSYMPVFSVAESYGEVISRSLGVPVYKLTHQHGHISSAMIGNIPYDEEEKQYIALHVSGGTTDVLKVTISRGIVAKIIALGEAKDISAGMFIDRIGVELDCGFPAGRELELLAGSVEPVCLPSYVRGCSAGFSGAEAAAKRMIDSGLPHAQIASGVLRCVANSLEKLIREAVKATGVKDILLFGGVMCNEIIRRRLSDRLPYTLIFADKAYSSDNACGLALQARNIFLRGT